MRIYGIDRPYRTGPCAVHPEDSVPGRTTQVYFSPLDFIARVAALVPPPRMNLLHYHGAFAANSALRAAHAGALRQALRRDTGHACGEASIDALGAVAEARVRISRH